MAKGNNGAERNVGAKGNDGVTESGVQNGELVSGLDEAAEAAAGERGAATDGGVGESERARRKYDSAEESGNGNAGEHDCPRAGATWKNFLPENDDSKGEARANKIERANDERLRTWTGREIHEGSRPP